MKIKHNMYVRTKDKRGNQYIRKITSVNETYPDKLYAGIYVDKEIHNVGGVSIKNILKASHNIIDLLEKGDYVNGNRVKAIYLDGTRHYAKLDNAYENGEGIRIYNEDIKSIVTKEQFSQMEYKIN